MISKVNYLQSIVAAITLLAATPGLTDAGAGGLEGLAGRVFAVEARIVYSEDAAEVGAVFNNCYTFNEDGTWFDPLYPDPDSPVPGYWVQHSDSPKIAYTATVSESVVQGLLLTQNGVVNSAQKNGRQKLVAYTTVYFEGLPIVEVVSRGHAVDSCPYF